MLRLKALVCASVFSCLLASQAAFAAVVQVTAEGTITGPFAFVPLPADIQAGDPFSLTFRFDTDPARASKPLLVGETDETGFEFSGPAYGVSGTIGGVAVAFDRTVAGLADDEYLESTESLGLVPEGFYDGFLLAGQSADGDFDLSGLPTTGTHVGIGVYTTVLDTYPDASWYQAPPSVPGVGVDTLMSFGVFDGATFLGQPIPSVMALGKVTSLEVTAVPLPAAGWLLLSALGLFGLRVRLSPKS
jgi:hypothetical protein